MNFLRAGLLFLCVAVSLATKFGPYTGHKVFRITPQSTEDIGALKLLLEYDWVDVWKEPHNAQEPVDIRVSPDRVQQLKRYLETFSLEFRVMIEDVQVLIDSQHTVALDHDSTRYYNLTEIYEYIDEMVVKCGGECSSTNIGQSFEGRDLQIIQIGETREGGRNSIWIDCGIHAREWISPSTCQFIIDRLISDTDNDTLSLRSLYTWYIHPVLNVDGYEYTWTTDRMWRKTRKPNPGSECDGVDGNRNFDLGFAGEGSSDSECSQTYRGPEAFSEVETAALDNFVRPIGDQFMLALTIHSYGQFFVYPWGYTTEEDPENIDDLAQVAQAGEDAINAVYDMGYVGRRSNGDMAGNTIDWAKGSCGIPYAYLFELRDTGEYGFLLPPEFIQPTGEEIWAGVKAMAFEIASIEGL